NRPAPSTPAQSWGHARLRSENIQRLFARRIGCISRGDKARADSNRMLVGLERCSWRVVPPGPSILASPELQLRSRFRRECSGNPAADGHSFPPTNVFGPALELAGQ